MTRIEFFQSLLGAGAFPLFPVLGTPSPNLDTEDDPEWLTEWNRSPILPIVESADPTLNWLATAVQREIRIEFTYTGGTTPGSHRTVTPLLLFVRLRPKEVEEWLLHHYEYRVFEGKQSMGTDPFGPGDTGPVDFDVFTEWAICRAPAYMMAWCHTRESKRCFRVDRMTLEQEMSIYRKEALPMSDLN